MQISRSPQLSVVVTVVGGGEFLRRCLASLASQMDGITVEILVPYDDQAGQLEGLVSEFPQVQFLPMGTIRTEALPGTRSALHELYDRRISHGICSASGEIVAILQDFCIPETDWCRQVLEAHQLALNVIGGAVEHKGKGALNWAVYFLDFGRYQLPLAEGPADTLTDINVTYKKAVLDPLQDLWSERYEEVVVNRALQQRGEALWQRPQIVVGYDRGRLSLGSLMAERYAWGRLLGSLRAKNMSTISRVLHLGLSPVLPFLLSARIGAKVFRTRRNQAQFLQALIPVLLMASIWSFGEFMGYLTRREA